MTKLSRTFQQFSKAPRMSLDLMIHIANLALHRIDLFFKLSGWFGQSSCHTLNFDMVSTLLVPFAAF